MTYFADLSPCEYFGFEGAEKLKAVGWLDATHDFKTGPVDRPFVDRLIDLLIDPWQPVVALGFHDCSLCRLSGGPRVFNLTLGEASVHLGSSNLFVPGDGCLFVAPSTIIHYIDAHQYAPPKLFRRAVIECPPMRSIDYFKALLKNGPPGIGKWARGPS